MIPTSHSEISNSSPEMITVDFENAVYGSGIAPIDGFNYRVQIETLKSFLVLYPQKINGSVEIEVGDIDASSNIHLVIEASFNVTEIKETGKSESFFKTVIFNTTLQANSNTILSLDDIDHLKFKEIQLSNGTKIPTTSYNYFNEVSQNSIISSTLNIFLEGSNHTSDWENQVNTITMKYTLKYLGDPTFYQFLENKLKPETNTDKTINHSLILAVSSLLFLKMVIYRKRTLN
jgi:hypothetical protein